MGTALMANLSPRALRSPTIQRFEVEGKIMSSSLQTGSNRQGLNVTTPRLESRVAWLPLGSKRYRLPAGEHVAMCSVNVFLH